MALQGSGAISINNINVELGKAGTTTSSLGLADFRTLAGVASGAISMSNFYGKSKYISASGGTITTYGNYRVHTFSSSGTFTVSQVGDITGNIDYLIVAGGGGGGRNSAASGRNPGAAYPSTLRTSATEYYAQGGYGNYYDRNTGTAGGANTGYGGGGNYSTDGSNGGSGIVIIRYQISG